MKKLRWQLIIIFLTGMVVGILLLSEQPETQQQLKAQPVKGGIYTEALIGSLQRLNPVLDYYNPVDRDVDRLVFSGLIRFDERGLPKPDLAESWGVSKDGTIYNFTLRTGIRWHDGQPLTSNDVVFTIERFRQGGSTIPEDLQAFWQEVQVKSLSDTQLQFQLSSGYAPFLDHLTFGILPEHLLGDLSYDQLVASPFNLKPVGSGPYRFDRLIMENNQITGVVLSVFDGYYSKPAFIDQVIFRYYPDSRLVLDAYEEGTVQGISHITPEILPEALALPNLSLYTGREPKIAMVLLNLNSTETPFFKDVAVRQALLYGMNRQWMVDRLLNGQAVVTDTPILPGTWAYYDSSDKVEFDPEKAQKLLKDAGYALAGADATVRKKENIELKFTLLHPDDEMHKMLAENIQKNWSTLNIQVTLAAIPYKQLVNDKLELRAYQAALVDLNLARSPDPDPYPFWNQSQATGGQNYSQWDNRTASEYLEQARVTIDINERARLYHNFLVIFSQELPSLPLFYPVYNYGVDRQVLGVRFGPLFDPSDRLSTLPDWYLEARVTPKQATNTPLK